MNADASNLSRVNIGIIGLGTVGAGTAEVLLTQRELMRERTGIDLVLTAAADRSLDKDFGCDIPKDILTDDASSVCTHPDVHVVVELIGGTGIARTLTLEALNAGKSVVTANKALLAEHGPELFAVAEEKGVDLLFEAAVAGGIPIIKSLREGLVANPVASMYGILNGTCNYILTRMEREGVDFDSVLAEAQKLGYAEAEPSLDVDGWDTAHKAVLLAQLAFGGKIGLDDFPVSGIRGISGNDVEYAAELGYRIKLLAILKNSDSGVEVSVEPALIPVDHMISKVDMSFNAVFVEGDIVGNTMYYGRGAGRLPTASAVVADIVDAARNRVEAVSVFNPMRLRGASAPAAKAEGDRITRTYLRLHLQDEPGTLAKVTKVFGDQNISLEVVNQKEDHADDKLVPVILVTGEARVADVDLALETCMKLDEVGEAHARFRVENLSMD